MSSRTLMDLPTLVGILENQSTWSEANVYQKSLSSSSSLNEQLLNPEEDCADLIREILSHLSAIILNKQQQQQQQHHGKEYTPLTRLGGLRVLKSCLEAGNTAFNTAVQEYGDFLKQISEFAKVSPSSKLFSQNPSRAEAEISFTFFTHIIEGFLIWSIWFPNSIFSQLKQHLEQTHRIVFPQPSQLKIFREKHLKLYQNGEFKKKKKNEQLNETTASQQHHQVEYQTISISNVQQHLNEFESSKQQLVQTLKSSPNPPKILLIFKSAFTKFSKFAEHTISNLTEFTQQLPQDLQETFLNQSEACVILQNLIDSYVGSSISFEQFKESVLNKYEKQQKTFGIETVTLGNERNRVPSNPRSNLNEKQKQEQERESLERSRQQSQQTKENQIKSNSNHIYFSNESQNNQLKKQTSLKISQKLSPSIQSIARIDQSFAHDELNSQFSASAASVSELRKKAYISLQKESSKRLFEQSLVNQASVSSTGSAQREPAVPAVNPQREEHTLQQHSRSHQQRINLEDTQEILIDNESEEEEEQKENNHQHKRINNHSFSQQNHQQQTEMSTSKNKGNTHNRSSNYNQQDSRSGPPSNNIRKSKKQEDENEEENSESNASRYDSTTTPNLRKPANPKRQSFEGSHLSEEQNHNNKQFENNPKFFIHQEESRTSPAPREAPFFGFEQIPFTKQSTLKSRVQAQETTSNSNNYSIPNRQSPQKEEFNQEQSSRRPWGSPNRSRVRISSNQNLSESRRQPIFQNSQQSIRSGIRSPFEARERANPQHNADMQSQLKSNGKLDSVSTLQRQEQKEDLENRVSQQENTIFAQRKQIDQQQKDMDSMRQIMRQLEQQKAELNYLLDEKKKETEEEIRRTKQQLTEYVNSTQKSQNSKFDHLQKDVTTAQKDIQSYQTELQKKELENADLRTELRVLKNKEKTFNEDFLKEKEVKIADLKSKFAILNEEIQGKDARISELSAANLNLMKKIDFLETDLKTSDAQIEIQRQNVIQKEIEISQINSEVQQTLQKVDQKDSQIQTLEHKLALNQQSIDQIKLASDRQNSKLLTAVDEQQATIQQLQQQRRSLEQRIDSLQQQHAEETNRLFQAGKLTEDEKRKFKQIIDENQRIAQEMHTVLTKETAHKDEISRLQKKVEQQKKEQDKQEKSLDELVFANNMMNKKLNEKDEELTRNIEENHRNNELRERQLVSEQKHIRQAMESLKLEHSRKETDLQRNIETLKRENELLINNLKVNAGLSSNLQSRIMIKNQVASEAAAANSKNYSENQDRSIYENYSNTETKTRSHPPLHNNSEPHSYNNNNNEPSESAYTSKHSIQPSNNNNNKQRKSRNNATIIYYNPAYFSYLQIEPKQFYRFKKSCLKSKIALYSDLNLNVGIITELKEIEAKVYLLISVFYENKSISHPLNDVTISYEADQSVSLFKKPTQLPTIFKQGMQYQQQLLTESLEIPFKFIECRVSYTVDGMQRQAQFPLPNSINKFFSIVPSATSQDVLNAFEKYRSQMQCSQMIEVDKHIASSQYDYSSLFPAFMNLGNAKDDDDPALEEFQCIGGQFYVKSIDTNIWLKINYDRKSHRVLFQVVHDQLLEDSADNTIKYLLQTLMMVFRESKE